MTPDDLQRADSNLVGGDSGAGSSHFDQFFAFRPSLALSRYRTPVRGLYLAGAGTWPGGGVNGISGELAARALLRGRRRVDPSTSPRVRDPCEPRGCPHDSNRARTRRDPDGYHCPHLRRPGLR